MGRYPVISDFMDKETKKVYRAGQVYETSNRKRAEAIRQRGFIGDEIEPEKTEEPTEEKSKTGGKRGRKK
jgi:hypothetical protein